MSIRFGMRKFSSLNTSLLRNSALGFISNHQNHFKNCFSMRSPNDSISGTINSQDGQKKKKTNIIPKITLIQGDNLSVTTLEEAQKLSKRRDLKLVKIMDLDTKTQRPIYRLMTNSEYHAEDLKQKEQKNKEKTFKGEKMLLLNHNIFENDLQTQIRKIFKWIGNLYEVRVVINGDSSNMEKAELVYHTIEKSVSTAGRILQKRQKGSDIKFQIIPPKKVEKDPNSS